MLFLKQSTAVTVKIGPFLDSTDGNTQETGLTIAQADVQLSKNGGAFAQKNDATSCTHDSKGFYGCPLNATDTGTLGRLQLIVHVTGALAVWHEFMVLAANIYDSLFGGADYLDVAVVEQANIDFGALQKASLNAATPASVVGAVGSVTAGVTVTTNNDKTGYALSAAAVQAIWDALTSALTTVGSIGKKLADWVVGTIDTYTGNTKQTGDSFARLGAPAGASVSADVAAVKAQTAAIETDTQDLQTQVGTDGAGLTAIGDTRIANLDAAVTTRAAASVCTEGRLAELDAANLPADIDTLKTRLPSALTLTSGNVHALVKAEDNIDFGATKKTSIETAVQNKIEVNDLDHITKVSAGATKPTDGSYLDQVMNKDANQTFDSTTDSLEALSDSGGGGLTQQQVRDALKLAPSAGAPADNSVDKDLDEIKDGSAGDFDNTKDTLHDLRAKVDTISGGSAINIQHDSTHIVRS